MLFNESEYRFPCLPVEQPIGKFYIAAIPYKALIDISYSDVRRLEKEREVETYLGIQRPLQKKRVVELQEYVNTFDACFPTAIIIAIDGRCAEFHGNELVLRGYQGEDAVVPIENIAKVLDGQHRIAGLEGYKGTDFVVPVSVFVDIDIADQAYLFSTVNLAQTKVQKSLAYDLYELAKARSPQKTCHNIAVALDRTQASPFFEQIKRLGSATEGRAYETLTQATFVESLLPYISSNAIRDRDMCLRGEKLSIERNPNLIFREMFIDEKDFDIADVVWGLFDAVRERWPVAWDSREQGMMLNKTNGFRAFMKYLLPAYRLLIENGQAPSKKAFLELLSRVELKDEEFKIDNFKPGSGGQARLASLLIETLKI